MEVAWDDILTADVNGWLENAVLANSSTKGIMYITLLTTTSSLLSTSSINVYAWYNECPNMFTLVLAPFSSSHWTPFQH